MPSIRFEVVSTEVREKKGTSPRTQRPYLIREQECFINTGEKYPVQAKINLNDQAPMDVGMYEVGQECVYVARYGDVGLDLTRARKVPSAQVAPAPSARVAG